MEETKETRPSKHNRRDTHMNSESEAACIGPDVSPLGGVLEPKGKEDTSLAQKLSLIDMYLKMKSQFL